MSKPHPWGNAGSQKRRTRARAETRQKILDAARDMFVRNGYEATTMRAIADRIEYTPTAIYHHFRNKEALLTELSQIDFRALATAFTRIGQIADPVERLRRIGEAYVSFALEHPMQYQLMFMTPRPDGVDLHKDIARGDPDQDAYGFLRAACADAIDSGRLRAEFTDPDELAQMLWSAKHGLLALHIVKQNDDWVDWRDARRTASRMNEVIIRGLLKRP
jgi:AcrR family transcriptional regulator